MQKLLTFLVLVQLIAAKINLMIGARLREMNMTQSELRKYVNLPPKSADQISSVTLVNNVD